MFLGSEYGCFAAATADQLTRTSPSTYIAAVQPAPSSPATVYVAFHPSYNSTASGSKERRSREDLVHADHESPGRAPDHEADRASDLRGRAVPRLESDMLSRRRSPRSGRASMAGDMEPPRLDDRPGVGSVDRSEHAADALRHHLHGVPRTSWSGSTWKSTDGRPTWTVKGAHTAGRDRSPTPVSVLIPYRRCRLRAFTVHVAPPSVLFQVDRDQLVRGTPV